jgi:hypothetical protein
MKVRFGFACRGQAELPLDGFPRLVDHLLESASRREASPPA